MTAHVIELLRAKPGWVGFVGSVSGWASFDFLRASQIAAAVLAGLVSLCSLILIADKVFEKLCKYSRAVKAWWTSKP